METLPRLTESCLLTKVLLHIQSLKIYIFLSNNILIIKVLKRLSKDRSSQMLTVDCDILKGAINFKLTIN
jgi:hypothetical protein